MKCQKCKNDFEERQIQEHHIHPRFMDNPKGYGMKLQLCEKCHNILHLKIPTVLYKYIPNKKLCIKNVIDFTERWLNDKSGTSRI